MNGNCVLTADGCAGRRRRLFEHLSPEIDWVLLTRPESITWLSAFVISPFTFRAQEASAALLVSRDGTAVLIADNLLTEHAQEAFVTDLVSPVWYQCVEAAGDRDHLLVKTIRDQLQSRRIGRCAVERDHCPAGILAGLSTDLPDVRPVIRRLRRQKDADEVTAIERSLRCAEAGLAAARQQARPGMSELDLFLIVQRAATELAGETVLIYGDFVCGARTQQGGGVPKRERISKGDLILLDFSVLHYGYRGDFCSTFLCDGSPTSRQRELEAACLSAQAAAEKKLFAGQAVRDVDAAARDVFRERGLLELFPHHTGHGIGLGHPEPPYFVPESDETLLVGDVVTLEPGLYEAGVTGMRFEHCYEITGDGPRRLSQHPLGL